MPPGHLCHVDTFVMGMPLSRPSLLPAVLPPRHRIRIWDCYSMLISPVLALLHSHTLYTLCALYALHALY